MITHFEEVDDDEEERLRDTPFRVNLVGALLDVRHCCKFCQETGGIYPMIQLRLFHRVVMTDRSSTG